MILKIVFIGIFVVLMSVFGSVLVYLFIEDKIFDEEDKHDGNGI